MLEKQQILDACYEAYKVQVNWHTTFEMNNLTLAAIALRVLNHAISTENVRTVAFYLDNSESISEVRSKAIEARLFYNNDCKCLDFLL